ncbi:MAG: peptidase M23 [Flavobacteriaceae bacterium]|nr:peptidase M23 [Flavobacteriaceae bacterium]
MSKKNKSSNKIIKKLTSRYRMLIVNEETFEEQFQFRLSRLNVIIVSIFLFSIFSVGLFFTIAYTPLREYIPGYDSSEIRKNAIENLFVTDSLINIYEKNSRYLNSVKKVLTGENLDESFFSNNNLENDSIVEKFSELIKGNKADSILRKIVDQEDKYNFDQNEAFKSNLFLNPPARGPISQEFNVKEEHFAVDIVLEENSPIKSIADGTVIFSEWTAQTGYVIIVRHNYGFMSVYKHNSSLSKKQGELVLTGEVIAAAGNTGEYSTGSHLHFELWLEGYPMDPKQFLNFD